MKEKENMMKSGKIQRPTDRVRIDRQRKEN